MATKTYELRASAIRAARKEGLKDGEFEVKQVWEGKGKSHWEYVAKVDAPVATETAITEPTEPESGAVTGEVTTTPTPKLVVEDYADQPTTTATATEPAPTPTEQPPAEPKPKNKSTVANPTKAVWAIADEMKAKDPNVSRKQVVEECVRRGVVLYTAKTQYQRWTKAK